MFRLNRFVQRSVVQGTKRFSSDVPAKVAAPQAPVKVASPPSSSSGGSTFFQRFSSFLAGCGVGFGTSYYFLYSELVDSNECLLRNIKQINGYKEK